MYFNQLIINLAYIFNFITQNTVKGVHMSEKVANIIIAILSISIFVVMVLYVVLPSVSYYQERKEVEGLITVGQANFEFVNDLPLFSNLTNFAGGQIDENVRVINARDKSGSNTDNLVDCYLRFKVEASPIVTPNIDTNSFMLGSDGYYYYVGVFAVGQTLELVQNFDVDINLSQADLDGVDVNVVVDTMQATKSMIQDIFTTAPTEWINSLE